MNSRSQSRSEIRMRGMALLAAEAQSAITVLEDRLAAAGQESAELRRELYEAAQMQRYLCGPRLMRRGSFEIAAEMFPVRHLSGDFFCVAELGAMILLGIGDICGKGMLAGMWSIHLLELTRMFGANTGDPGMALRALNKSMCARSPLPPLTSLFLAYMDCESGELLYCNAGHPAALLLRSDGTTQLLSEGGPVLGVLADAEFHSARITMEQGDTLLAFSDGLPECCNESAEEFETERIIAEVRKAESLSTSEMLFSVVGAAQDFAGSCPREDDCTLMVARCVDMPAAA